MHKLIETTFGVTPIEVVGEGPEAIVFHGGPGFTHDYLLPHLHCLSRKCKLFYFDQLGSGASFNEVCDHANEILCAMGAHDDRLVIAHSWGVVVLLACLARNSALKPRGLLIAPTPTSRTRFDAMRAELLARLPEGIQHSLSDPKTERLTLQEIDRILPLYFAPSSNPVVPHLTFDITAYRSILFSSGDFDFSNVTPRLKDCAYLTGEFDFISPRLVSDIVENSRSVHFIEQAGHFPFIEQPEQFLRFADHALSWRLGV